MRNAVECIATCLAVLALGTAGIVADEPIFPRNKGNIQWEFVPAAAAERAQQSGKTLLVYVTAENCGYCRKMERGSWTDADVIKIVNAKFVPLKVDADKHRKLISRLGIDAYPTTIVFDVDGRRITSAEGFLNRAGLLKLLAKANSKVLKQE